MYSLVCLNIFMQHQHFEINIYLFCVYVSSSFLLSSRALYGHTTVYPFPCWWTFELLSEFDADTDKAAVNIHAQVFV